MEENALCTHGRTAHTLSCPTIEVKRNRPNETNSKQTDTQKSHIRNAALSRAQVANTHLRSFHCTFMALLQFDWDLSKATTLRSPHVPRISDRWASARVCGCARMSMCLYRLVCVCVCVLWSAVHTYDPAVSVCYNKFSIRLLYFLRYFYEYSSSKAFFIGQRRRLVAVCGVCVCVPVCVARTSALCESFQFTFRVH